MAFKKADWGKVKDWNNKLIELNPNDRDAHYQLGVAYRETGRFKALLLRKLDFGKSQKHFDTVIHADSSFKDVIYQRGLLERYRHQWSRAIAFGHLQIDIKPELAHAQTGLFKLYRLLLHNKADKEVASWLTDQMGAWPEYFLGENHRQNARFAQADSILQSLLAGNSGISTQPVYLSLLRSSVQQQNQEDAQRYFDLALGSIQTHIDAEFLFEDCKLIFTEKELEIFRSLDALAQKREFFRTFWATRNPMPASPINYRALEHFRRLVFAENNYWYDGVHSKVSNPDQLTRLRFPRTRAFNQELNDKGLIYLRHGEPNDRARTGGLLISNESWHYYKRPDRPEYIFHFLVGRNAPGGSWRLAPYLSNRQMLADRLGWDHNLDRLYYAASGVEHNSAIHEISAVSTKQVFAALSSDSHTWRKDLKFLPTKAYGTFFKGAEGKTRVELYVGVPLPELRMAGQREASTFEHGASILDQGHNAKGSHFETINCDELGPARVFGGLFIHRYLFEVEPNRYQLSFYTKLDDPEKLGGGNFNIQVPAFGTDELSLSDLELASAIEPAGSSSVFTNRDLRIIPNPAKEFSLSDPVSLYYEVYNLTKNQAAATSFEIESKLTQKKGKKFLGIFGGGKKKSVSIKNFKSGTEVTAFEYENFDVNKLDPGEYTLIVRVQDLNSNQTVEKSIDLKLTKN